jgi:predicted site-specific integrase-resolvase
MSLQRFCEITGLSKVSAWRYEKRGWLRTHLIANRRYILAADVAEFNRRETLGLIICDEAKETQISI